MLFRSKILKEMGIPEHLICLWRNLYAGQEATVRTGPPTFDCGCKGAQIAPRSGNNPSTRACGWRGTCRTRQAGDRLPSTTDAGSSDPEAAPGTRVQPGYGRQSAQTNHRSVWVAAVSCLPELVAACADLRDEMGKAGPSCPKCWRGLCPVCCGTYSSRPA